MSALTCPKCRADMHNYERNGIAVDQCSECRGIFLDRGELEHLVAADARAQGKAPPAAPPPRADSHEPRHESYDPRRESYDSRRESYDPRHGSGSSHQPKRKKHWVEELFG